MMNNIGELFSLIHFLRIKPYCDLHKFNAVGFLDCEHGDSSTDLYRTSNGLCKAIVPHIRSRLCASSRLY